MFSDIPLFGVLQKRMSFLSHRHKWLASNIANANTPHYRPVDIKQTDFKGQLKLAKQEASQLKQTHPMHIDTSSFSTGSVKSEIGVGFEITPGGNGVVLEEEMMKMADNQFQYQLATDVYSRALGLVKKAIGHG